MFEKTLTDVVKGIRASKRDTGLYISQCIAEIKQEINSTDLYVKANALNKLTFLQMMGYGMSWASFASIEVMSSPRFAHKRIGYLAASQSFNADTDVILLTTNLLQKELRGAIGGAGNGVYEAGLAINCISNIVTEDLARDLLPELTNLTSHPSPYLRKKAILCLFKVFVKYPQGLRLCFEKIQQALASDANPSVVSCAVNVITELSDKNPKNYLHLAPAFFQLLTNSQNNWMLIKVVKLLGSLVPEEPRLARKLLEPLSKIVRETQAKSLLYEAVYTMTLCLPYCRKADGSMPASVPGVVELCHETLKAFVEEQDQNLKYLGLVGFCSLLQSHPSVLQGSDARPLILACLSDEDVTIRTRALDLLKGMTSRKNLTELVHQLLQHVEQASGTYKQDLILKIVDLCSSDKYALLQDFEWYLDVLWKLMNHSQGMSTSDLGHVLEKQVTDVALRVLPVRPYAVKKSMVVLLEKDREKQRILPQEVLPAIAWIVGEYSDLIDADTVESSEASMGTYHALIQSLTAPKNSHLLPTSAQAVYVQAAMKVFAAATKEQKVKNDELVACVATLHGHLPVFMQSMDVEVQERSFTGHQLLLSLHLAPDDEMPLSAPIGLIGTEDEASDDEDNLLGMMDSSADKSKKSKPSSIGQSSSSSSLATRCRSAAPTLNYILKPEPMKPISAKAQRKKQQAPIGIDSSFLNAPVDFSVWGDDAFDDPSNRPSMEQVSFTQQKRMEPVVATPHVAMEGFGSTSAPSVQSMTPASMPPSSTSFQHPEGPTGQSTSALNQVKSAHDPFYLDSAGGVASHDAEMEPPASDRHPNRFGMIQLFDDDEETPGGKKKKKKKERRKKASAKAATQDGAADLALFATPGVPSKPAPAATNFTVYTSDDDTDEDDTTKLRKKGPSKEFEGLAKVDLTSPLREDEVIMPKREHRVVPEQAQARRRKPSKKVKKKKESKRSKKEEDKTGGGTSDLLDLGDFSSVPETPSATSMMPPQASSSISTAFDDLLGLTAAPVPATEAVSLLPPPEPLASPTLPASTPTKSTKISKKRPWMKGSLKAASADGSSTVDWSKVAVYYKVSGSTSSANITLRVDNGMDSTSLNSLSILWKGRPDKFVIGTVEAGQSQQAEAGPFSYAQPDASLDLKGSLATVEGSTVPIKITLPASLYLNPTDGLTQEQVMEELASGSWSLHSVKLDIVNANPSKIKSILMSFFRAAEVEPTSSSTGTLAAQSLQGAKVRVLFKLKESSVKVDIKCTNSTLSKALASDAKRIVL